MDHHGSHPIIPLAAILGLDDHLTRLLTTMHLDDAAGRDLVALIPILETEDILLGTHDPPREFLPAVAVDKNEAYPRGHVGRGEQSLQAARKRKRAHAPVGEENRERDLIRCLVWWIQLAQFVVQLLLELDQIFRQPGSIDHELARFQARGCEQDLRRFQAFEEPLHLPRRTHFVKAVVLLQRVVQ